MPPLLLTFTGLSPAHLASFEKPQDPFALRVQEAVWLETMDLSDGTQEAWGSVVGMGLLLQVAFPWFHLPTASLGVGDGRDVPPPPRLVPPCWSDFPGLL